MTRESDREKRDVAPWDHGKADADDRHDQAGAGTRPPPANTDGPRTRALDWRLIFHDDVGTPFTPRRLPYAAIQSKAPRKALNWPWNTSANTPHSPMSSITSDGDPSSPAPSRTGRASLHPSHFLCHDLNLDGRPNRSWVRFDPQAACLSVRQAQDSEPVAEQALCRRARASSQPAKFIKRTQYPKIRGAWVREPAQPARGPVPGFRQPRAAASAAAAPQPSIITS